MTIERYQIANREQWLDLRRADITASDVAIVCGMGAYGSAAELYAEKKGLRPPLVDSGVLKRGRWGEAAVFEALLDVYPEWEIRRAKIYLRDPELRLGATPDGFAIAPDRDGIGVVQAKVVSRWIFRNKWLDDYDDNIQTGSATPPDGYMLQTLTEEMLAEAKWGCLAVLINGEYDWSFRLFNIPRSADFEHLINSNVRRFWRDYLDPNIMPMFDPLVDERLVKLLYPQDSGETIDLTRDNRALQLVEDFVEKKAGVKRLNTDIDAIQTELQGKLGSNTFGILADGRRLSWKTQHRKAYSVEASHPRVFKILKPERES